MASANFVAPDPALVEKLVYANRILYDQNVVDGLGHASVRHNSMPDTFLLSCNRAPALVKRKDITCYNLDGDAVSDTTERPYLERFIHAEIYRARPDVVAVVHSHSQSVIPFGATKNRLMPIFHMAGFLGSGSSHFEMRDVDGNTDLLIRNRKQGAALAAALGNTPIVLMRGHGSTCVGTASLEQAVFRAVYAEVNAKLQLNAIGLGEVIYLNPEEAQMASDTNDSQIVRSWTLWQGRVGSID